MISEGYAPMPEPNFPKLFLTHKGGSERGHILQGFLFGLVKTTDFNARRSVIVMPPFTDFILLRAGI